VLQRQPPAFWNADVFSILNLCEAISAPGDCFAWPDFKSQHMPVQLDAIEAIS
jgi:hypothetical protein